MEIKKLAKLSLFFLLIIGIRPQPIHAQLKLSISDVSVAFTDVQHGLPFNMISPVHPGIEGGFTFLKKEKEKSFHAFNTTLGFYNHNQIANASYLDFKYNYQIRIKERIGVDLHSGLGLIYSLYPGEGYSFNESTKTYESTTNGQASALVNLGFGFSYTQNEKIQPFIHYDFNVYNIWAYSTFVNSTSILKAGVKINL